MKKILSIITITAAVAVVMASCKGGNTTTPVLNQDTAGFAQFQAWKLQTEAAAAIPVATTKNAVAKRSSGSTNGGTMTSSTSNEAKTVKKKGWSKAAKGTAIGATGGAVLGAVINKKNRVAGGVIGGILGGGLGYGIGRSQDKKDGRY